MTDDRPFGRSGRVLWVSWERHRRTRQLAEVLGVPLLELTTSTRGVLRYVLLGVRTIAVLTRQRPGVLLVQNPSIFLAVLASVLKPLFHYRLVVDRHTNFMINRADGPVKRLFGIVSRLTLRSADLTIITNRYLAALVRAAGGSAFVLPDRIPKLTEGGPRSVTREAAREVCFVCTYAADEPFEAVFRAAGSLPGDVRVYVTGRLPGGGLSESAMRLVDEAPQVVLTGYLSNQDYEALLVRAGVIVDLTTLDHCLVCGAYEAIAAGRPFILSDKAVNRELFGDCAIFVDNCDPESIRMAILEALERQDVLARSVVSFRERYVAAWDQRVSCLERWVGEREVTESVLRAMMEDVMKP